MTPHCGGWLSRKVAVPMWFVAVSALNAAMLLAKNEIIHRFMEGLK